jgi:putative transposase
MVTNRCAWRLLPLSDRGNAPSLFAIFNQLIYNYTMKLTLQIKLLPTLEQFNSLKQTMLKSNAACNKISEVAWNEGVFNKYKLQHLVYYDIKNNFGLSAQMVVRCLCKVADAYKLDRKSKRQFRPLGAVTYDARILTFKIDSVSIWSVDGRLKIPFVCHNPKYLPYIKGEADLVFNKGKFYLFQTVEVVEDDVHDIEGFIGVDFGVTDIATLSDGTSFCSDELYKTRDKYFKTRRSVQSKGTVGSRKLLKRLKGREWRFATITNHTIAKQVVEKAKALNLGIAIEDLTHIHKTTKVRKTQRRKHYSWAFAQLRSFLTYKSKLLGIPLEVVPPAYTSQTCSVCHAIGKRRGKVFKCTYCGNIMDADVNAARNIAQLGLTVNQPEKMNVPNFVCHLRLKAVCFS